MSDALFDLEAVRMDSPRMQKLRRWDVQTDYAENCPEAPWLAIPMVLARRILDLPEDDESSLVDLCASDAVTLEDCGLLVTGGSEEEVEDEVLAVCRERGGDDE